MPALAEARTIRVLPLERVRLRRDQLRNALACQRNHLCHLIVAERFAFCGALQLDKAAATGHHNIHVGPALRIFDVVEVEDRDVPDDTDRDRSDLIPHRQASIRPRSRSQLTASTAAT